jgi:CheY-like chemotaxis protein/two-component sensor histidine kinase
MRARNAMQRQVLQMVHLVDDLLDVSRISTGKVTLRQEPVILADIVQQAVETSRPLITERNHQLIVDLPAEPVHLFADRTRLSQVLSNLLNNAAKYTDPGGRINLIGERTGGEVVLRVIDTGIGISAALLPRVFDLFVQSERSADRALGGLGIGLTVVQRLVQMHGGSIMARSEGLGRGSEFTVRLTCRPPVGLPSERSAPLLPEPAPVVVPAAGPQGKVLLIEDNEDVRATLRDLLLAHGYQMEVAGDGLEGLRLAQQWQPAVALIDIGLPKLDGYQVAARFRAELADPPTLIALSGYGQPEDRSRARAAGFSAHLVKPVKVDELLRVLAEAHAAHAAGAAGAMTES